MEDIFKRYKNKICQTCKAEVCKKNIIIIKDKITTIKCTNYIKDESKIKPTQKALCVTARQYKKMI